MNAFRALLALLCLAIVVYTVRVAGEHGMNLLPIFFSDIAAMDWHGQFNLDFMSLLTLSGLWLAWRHHFSPGGIVLGLLGLFGGGAVLTTYLFIASFSARGDVKVLLLGPRRAA